MPPRQVCLNCALSILLLFPNVTFATVTIVITPEWEEIDVQKTPMTVNVLSSHDLDARGIGSTFDVQNAVPGFVFKTNTVLGQPYLRGVGSDLMSIASDASVATFYDGVYQPRASSSIQTLYDIKRIEVSKGPQSVHLGRNVVGGAVSIVTNDPENYFNANGDMLLGSYNKREFRGMVNEGNPESDIAFRLAGLVVKRDGYTDNLFLARDLDNEDYYAWRGKLKYTPGTDLKVLLTLEQVREDSTRNLGQQPASNIGVSQGILLGGTVPGDPYLVNHSTDNMLDLERDQFNLKINKDFSGVRFLSITGYQGYKAKMRIELDGTEIHFAANHPRESSHTFLQEFRFLSSQKQPLGWVGGFSFMKEKSDQVFEILLPMASVVNRPSGDIKTRSYSAFGQLSYDASERIRATAGVRYSRDKRAMDFLQTLEDPFGALGPAGTVTIKLDEEKKWSSVTPEFGVEYKPSDESLIYGNISRGFKAGGFNTTAAQTSFNPEYLWAYEIGLKTTPKDSVYRFNGSIFHYDYKDMQVLTLEPGAPVTAYPIVTNATESTIQGVDLEIWYWPVQGLEFSSGITLLDAHFDKFISVDPNNPTANSDRSGNALPQAPDASVNLGAKYVMLFSHGTLTSRLDYRYQSDVYFNPFEDSAVRQEGYGLVDVGFRYESLKGHWDAEFFINNLTDKLYSETIIRQDPLVGTLYTWGAPRTLGVRFGYDY